MSNPNENGTTVGIWYGAGETVVDDFDDHFGTDDPQYSRSARIKDAMRLAIAIDSVLDETEDIGDRGTRVRLKSILRRAGPDED